MQHEVREPGEMKTKTERANCKLIMHDIEFALNAKRKCRTWPGKSGKMASVLKKGAKWLRRRDLHEMQLDFRQMNASFAFAVVVLWVVR